MEAGARSSGESSLPPLFTRAAAPRGLWALAATTLLFGVVMLPAMATMSDHGASVVAFEFAGSVARAGEILDGWGDAGKDAAWTQLVLDVPFLVGYGLFLAGACVAVARRAERARLLQLRQMALRIAWFGPVAAAADMVQNASLGLILAGHLNQPWPAISLVCGCLTATLMATGLAFVAIGFLRTRAAA